MYISDFIYIRYHRPIIEIHLLTPCLMTRKLTTLPAAQFLLTALLRIVKLLLPQCLMILKLLTLTAAQLMLTALFN